MTGNGAGPRVEPDFDLGASGCLAFLWPALPEPLVGAADRVWIERAAAALPPIPRLGLELPLGAEEHGADLHQQFRAGGADADILNRHLARGADGPLGDARLRTFLAGWAGDARGLRETLDRLYLEWDRPPAGEALASPALFYPVDRPGGRPDAQPRRRRAAIRHAERLRAGSGEAVAAAFKALSPHLPAGATLHYLGFMLGRAGALRVNLRGIRPPDLTPLLAAVGWPGDKASAARHFGRLVGYSDRVIVALDFAPALQPRIGFEAVLDLAPEREPRWRALFDYLVGEGVCAEAKREALAAFPARCFPEDRDQPWPASWLLAAMLAPAHFVPWVERRLSHVKLSLAGDGRPAAKAYVSAEHHWSRRAAPRAARPPANPAGPEASIAAASDKAIGFLVAAIGQNDLWRDFSMPGASDEWATAFVGHALAGVEDARARLAAERSLDALLRRQRPDGGWGYNALCASDSDSTAWALKFMSKAGFAGPARDKARAFLLAHCLPGGGMATYAAEARVRFDDRPWDGPSEGWRGGHLCVAANAAGALPGELPGFLLARQAEDGSWPAYWWRTDAFATALAVEALAAGGEGAEARRRACRWARGQGPRARSAFDSAWLSQILLSGDAVGREAGRAMLVALAGEQEADGGWAAGAELLLPHPSDPARHDGLVPYLDVRRIFTTASVLAAMAASESVQ